MVIGDSSPPPPLLPCDKPHGSAREAGVRRIPNRDVYATVGRDREVGRMRRVGIVNGEYFDVLCYDILKKEYLALAKEGGQ